MPHSGSGISIFAVFWRENKSRMCLLLRLDDSGTCVEVNGCLFCGPTAASDKFLLLKENFSLTVGNFFVPKGHSCSNSSLKLRWMFLLNIPIVDSVRAFKTRCAQAELIPALYGDVQIRKAQLAVAAQQLSSS